MANLVKASEDLGKLLKMGVGDPRLLIEGLLDVEDRETREVVPFKFNWPQGEGYRVIREEWASGGRALLLVLKARKMGWSTLMQGLGYSMMVLHRRGYMMTVAHREDSARYIQGISENFQKQLGELFPVEHKTEGRSFHLRDSDSRIGMFVAGEDISRGPVVDIFHGSEVDSWLVSPKEVFKEVLPAVPRSGWALVVGETTAKKADGDFRELWQDSLGGLTGFRAVFLPWWVYPGYRAPVCRANGTGRPVCVANATGRGVGGGDMDYTVEELELRRLYNLDDGQLWWRRRAIREEFGGDIVGFMHEYPASWEEAFLASGESYFGRILVKEAIDGLGGGGERGDLVEKVEGYYKFEVKDRGRIIRFEEPRNDSLYVVGIDLADEGRDKCACEVLNCRTGEQAAEVLWDGDIWEFLYKCYGLGLYYNKATLAPELNSGYGLTALTVLRDELRYPRFYRREIRDERVLRTKEKLGWLTTKRTRPMMLSDFQKAFKYGDVVIRSGGLLNDMLSFSSTEDHIPDRLAAMCIAYQATKSAFKEPLSVWLPERVRETKRTGYR